MLTTSHFIGLELQNPLSPHITLYYLDSELSEDEHRQIRALIKDAARDDIKLTGLQVKYFGEAGNERVCFIGCDQNDVLPGLNQTFAKAINHAHVAENGLAFVAHISLFRIHRPGRFAQYKDDIEQIVNTFLTHLEANNLIGDVALYAVSSKYRPEIQIRRA